MIKNVIFAKGEDKIIHYSYTTKDCVFPVNGQFEDEEGLTEVLNMDFHAGMNIIQKKINHQHEFSS